MKKKRNEIDWSLPAGRRHKRKRKSLRRVLRIGAVSLAACVVAFGLCARMYWKQSALTETREAVINSEEVRQSAINRAVNTPSKSISRIPVFAHRGFAEDVLENSFDSYDLALASGCPQIELDVRTSADGVLYVSHDNNLINIADCDWEVSGHTSDELDRVVMKNGEKLHRLSEVLERYRNQLIYLVEFKDENADPEPFLSVMRQYPSYAENVQIQSFHAPILQNIHEQLPNMFVQLLVENKDGIEQGLSYDWLDSIALEQHMVSADTIARIKDSGREIWVWTVDDIDKVHQFLEMGVNGVITDLDSAVTIYRELSSQ